MDGPPSKLQLSPTGNNPIPPRKAANKDQGQDDLACVRRSSKGAKFSGGVISIKYKDQWDLDVFFPGGSRSPAFRAFLDQLTEELAGLEDRLAELERAGKTVSNGGATPGGAEAGATETGGAEAGTALPDPQSFQAVVAQAQGCIERLVHAAAFVHCLTAQDTTDETARLLEGRIAQLRARLRTGLNRLDETLRQVPDAQWSSLLAAAGLEDLSFPLTERRRLAADKMPAAMETLAEDLAVDGYHGWSHLYNTIVGRITIPWEEKGTTLQLSVGQAANRLKSPHRTTRVQLFSAWQKAWDEQAEVIAACLNHLAGYRLQLYKHRGWEDILQEPLVANRMTAATLSAMWVAVQEAQDHLTKYLQRKAQLLGLPALAWFDLGAPLDTSHRQVDYPTGAQFIVDHLRRFSPALASFAETALRDGWIEAEDRPGKRPGGFCTYFPLQGQSRIFMTYGGTPVNVTTLAHELGHAYHNHAVRDLPILVQDFPASLAETASTFAELIVSDAAIFNAADDQERLALLDHRLQNHVAYFMDIHARYNFELEFYRVRQEGPVPAAQLHAMMEAAQKASFRNALSHYEPQFWASKLHFYITGLPFYNFPYTFGHLFSLGLYQRARQAGSPFAHQYELLLRDTGRMTVEELAHRHLGVDLTQPDFWREAAQSAMADVETFIKLSGAGG